MMDMMVAILKRLTTHISIVLIVACLHAAYDSTKRPGGREAWLHLGGSQRHSSVKQERYVVWMMSCDAHLTLSCDAHLTLSCDAHLTLSCDAHLTLSCDTHLVTPQDGVYLSAYEPLL